MRDSLSPLIYPPTYSGQKFPQRTYKWQFYPWGDTLLLCKMSVYIQTHKTFPIQKICKSVTKKIFVNNSKSHEATNWQLSRPPTGTSCSPRPSPQATNWHCALPTPKSSGHQLATLQATNWQPQATQQRAPSAPVVPHVGVCPLQAPGLAEHLMGVWNTQIEPRSG